MKVFPWQQVITLATALTDAHHGTVNREGPINTRDRCMQGSYQPGVCSKKVWSQHGASLSLRQGLGRVPKGRGSELSGSTSIGSGIPRTNRRHTTTSSRSSATIISALALLFLFTFISPSHCIPSSALNSEPLSPNSPLVTRLLTLCRSDALCCQKWFIPPPPQPDPPSDFDRATFTRLLILFANGQLYSPDGTLVTVPAWENDATLTANALADPLTATALESLSDAYWLLLLRMAVFCGGAPNQFFLLGKGCTCAPGAVCSDGDGSFETSEFIALSILLAVCLFVTCWWFWQAIQDLLATRNLLAQVLQAITITRATPTVDLGFEPRRGAITQQDSGIPDDFAAWYWNNHKSKNQ